MNTTDFTTSSKLTVQFWTSGFDFDSAERLALLREVEHTGRPFTIDGVVINHANAQAILQRFCNDSPPLEQRAQMRREVSCLLQQIEHENTHERLARVRLATAA